VCVFIRYCLFVVVACQFVCVVSLMVETKRVLLLFSYSFDFGLFQQFTLCVCVSVGYLSWCGQLGFVYYFYTLTRVNCCFLFFVEF